MSSAIRTATRPGVHSDHPFALVAEASAGGIWERPDIANGEEWWSPRLYEILGYEYGEVEAHADTFVQLLHPEDRSATCRAIAELVERKARLDVLCRLRTRGGAYRWCRARGAVATGPDGKPLRMVGSLTDVHDQELARAELDRFFTLSMDLVCVVDVDGHLCRVNPAFTETLGYGKNELLDRPLLDLVHPDDVDDTIAKVAGLEEGLGTRGFQNRCRHRSGRWVWLSWTARPDSTGRVYAIARDVTEERHARDELARRAAELESTNEELEQFAYVASHDLQEPLRTLASYAALIDERYSEVLDDDGREFLAFMSEAANRMRTLIRALLDYSRLGRRDLETEVVDSGTVVGRVIRDLHASITEAGARVTVDSLPTLSCDPLLIPLVFQNLISNAIKFRGEAAPRIRVSAERSPVGWRFDVVDNGIGISESHRERVFEVFKRLNPRSRYDGTGIGLAVCRRIVHQHGGTVWCTDAPSGGTAFRFTIPTPDRRS